MTDKTLIELVEKLRDQAWDDGHAAAFCGMDDSERREARLAEIKSRLAARPFAVVPDGWRELTERCIRYLEPNDLVVGPAMCASLVEDLRALLAATPSSLRTITAEELERLERDAELAGFINGLEVAGNLKPRIARDDNGSAVLNDIRAQIDARRLAAMQSAAAQHQALRDRGVTCSYPACNCPVDGPDTCAIGLDRQAAQQQDAKAER